jgi:hypothetical protein
MSELRYCFKCSDKTPTIDEDCTVCNFSKTTPDHLKDKNHLDYMNRCLNEETTHENFAEYGEGVHKHWGHHFYEIYPAVNAMGGWANFRSWVKRHAETYFNYCVNHQNILAELVRLKKLKEKIDLNGANFIEADCVEYNDKKPRAWKQAFKLVSEQYDYDDGSEKVTVPKKRWKQIQTNVKFLEGVIFKKDRIIQDLKSKVRQYESKGALALLSENEALKLRITELEKSNKVL